MPAYRTTRLTALPDTHRGETVFVVHGFGGSRLMMAVLCNRLAQHGFDVCNWEYPSLSQGVPRIAAMLRNELTAARCQTGSRPIHVVAYSMGAVVARTAFLEMDLTDWSGRLVMLGPPNHGSPLARFGGRILRRWPVSIPDLSDQTGSFVRCLPAGPLPPTGIIAARFDHLVPVKNTRLDGVLEHRVINTIHKGLVFNREVSGLLSRFLESGSFAADRI